MLTGAVAIALLIGAAACGDDDSDTTATTATAEVAAGPEQAIAEIAEVRKLLDEGLAAYKKGDAAEAEELVTSAYLEHFELVEGPLEDVDPELNEELEELIRETTRDAISSGEPASKVEGLIKRANKGLDEAERKLEQTG
jgi:high-affinity iron transporter